MALTRVQISLQSNTGLPKDRYVNTFHITSPVSPPEAEGDTIRGIFNEFYEADHPGGIVRPAVRKYLNNTSLVTGEDTIIKLYHLEDAEPRVPFYTGGWDLSAAGGGTPLPEEVAMCMSFAGAPDSGTPAARRRGRVYLGPLNTQAFDVGTASHVRPSTEMIDTIIASGIRMGAALNAAGFKWVVYSPTSGTLVSFPVAQVSCDNAFDTQRRRGISPTARTTGVVAV